MLKIIFLIPLLVVTSHGNSSSAMAGEAKTMAEMLPARSLDCTLGRALNLDPTRNQTLDEIRHEGAHPFSLHLPSISKRLLPPPDPDQDPEPVDPATRITADPSGLANDRTTAFSRIVDMWPERVEIARPINLSLTRVIIVSNIDTQKGTANLFMARAADAASMDMNKVYQGSCRVKIVTATAAKS